MANYNYVANTNAIKNGIYPMVEKALSNTTIRNKYKKNISNFINVRSKELYDIAPYTRIYWRDTDEDEFFKTIGFTKKQIEEQLHKTYYWEVKSFNPKCAKDPFTVAQLMCIRYFLKHKMSKEIDLALVYLAFSGQMYPSIHYGSFPKAQPSEYPHIMEYVINNELSQKFDLKKEGSIIMTVKSICKTWLSAYTQRIMNCSDENITYVLQQFRDRIKSFMVNIASLYYKVYNDKDKYFTYDSDNMDPDNYRIADNDSLKGERYVSNAMNYITTHSVNYKFCKMSSSDRVRTDEVKSIMESIQSDRINIPLIRELISILIYEFLSNSKVKEVNGIDFITYAISAKPNTKNKNIIRQKEIVEQLLNENSEAYKRRRSVQPTMNAYHNCITNYYALVISQSNK